ncbi:hypothetical protein [Fibrobacter sp. UWP2]|uniref:hypothetical protein n=1 Tax=Fibrobacter sp. UWP2 TaxID=1896216 RepID=UPI000934B6DF|nr:hypothetical protein [Fibrobacter sp. UWP2]
MKTQGPLNRECVGIGFNVAGTATASGGPAEPANASTWGGICIVYTVDVPASLELGLGVKKGALWAAFFMFCGEKCRFAVICFKFGDAQGYFLVLFATKWAI